MNVGVIYGGVSAEHDVSIITAVQAMEVLSERHTPIPIYITRTGRWLSGEPLRDIKRYQQREEPQVEEISCDLSGGTLRPKRAGSRLFKRNKGRVIDVAFPAAHGTHGEDGALQGLLELCGIPYVGSSVGASAASMDKAVTKAVLQRHALPTLDSIEILREQWSANRAKAVRSAVGSYPLPVYVKPVSLGSSIGVRRCATAEGVEEALELAFNLDRAAIVEPSLEEAIEINCAVLGSPGDEPRTSVCEQPLRQDELLSFEDKYLRGGKNAGMKGAERIIPAPIDEATTEKVRELAKASFAALGCAGVVRVDFLVTPAGDVLINELNTIPGSFAFYLWEPAGLPFADLLDELLELAFREHSKAKATTRVFSSSLLSMQAPSGSKSAAKLATPRVSGP